MCPVPRPAAVSKRIQASVTPPASVGSSAVAKPDGSMRSRVALEQVGDAVAALDGGDVPGEGDQVAPVALGGEQLGGGLDVAGAQGGLERREPGVHALLRECRRRVRFESLRHGHRTAAAHRKHAPRSDRDAAVATRLTLGLAVGHRLRLMLAAQECSRGARTGGRLQRDPAGHRPVPACPRSAPRPPRGDRRRPAAGRPRALVERSWSRALGFGLDPDTDNRRDPMRFERGGAPAPRVAAGR